MGGAFRVGAGKVWNDANKMHCASLARAARARGVAVRTAGRAHRFLGGLTTAVSQREQKETGA
jgi:hypothetical protein